MDLSGLTNLIRPIQESLQKGSGPLHVTGLGNSCSKSFWLTLLHARARKNLLLVTESQEDAQTLYDDLHFFFKVFRFNPETIRLFPGPDLIPYEKNAPSLEIRAARIETLYHLMEGKPFILLTVPQSLHQKLPARQVLEEAKRSLTQNETFPQETLLTELTEMGYHHTSKVEQIGDFSLRGGIVDFFPPTLHSPVRLEYWGDRLESLRSFDPSTQKSTEKIPSVDLIPVRELIPKKDRLQTGRTAFLKRGEQLGLSPHQIEAQWQSLIRVPPSPCWEMLNPFLKPLQSLLDYIPRDTLILYDHSPALKEKFENLHHESWKNYRAVLQEGYVLPTPDELFAEPDAILNPPQRKIFLEGLSLSLSPEQAGDQVDFKTPESIGFYRTGSSFQTHVDLINRIRNTHRCWLVCRTALQLNRLRGLLAEHGVPTRSLEEIPSGGAVISPAAKDFLRQLVDTPSEPLSTATPVFLLTGDLSGGCSFPSQNLCILTEEEFLGHRVRHRPPSKNKVRPFLPGLDELEPKDWVVHLHHGIGRYEGLQRLTIQGVQNEFMIITYAGNDKLYVPLENLDLVQRYAGVEGMAPRMDRLGGATWSKTKQKVKRELEVMAEELLHLYALREVTQGVSFSSESTLSKEFEASFEYEETPDQFQAIEDVKKDLGRKRPMDRLICGDVGYGKTEVALRAAFKVVEDGKQVAILTPTTLLAQQHYQTFSLRFGPFPVRVEMLSRFRSPNEQKKIIKELREGQVDIVIGTHRLLQKDVQFQDLGLAVIDEEQRFGVNHKEHLKKLRTQVDVLTLTATPIPRTLQFSLIGARDISIIETPPADRLSIRTHIIPFSKQIIREAIQRELYRGGQVFFVHNRVQSIERMAHFLRELVPDATIGIAHGQMSERLLEKVMKRFIQKEHQILLCTSIIESGLDIPDANTILIHRADQFGLSELYQLRGRVGRSGQQAYAYLLVPEERVLTAEARKRLRALQEFSELGAGFRIAARDLEIRGAGSLLGKKQSGHIAALGFEFYLQMIEKTVKELKGEKVEEDIEPSLHLNISAFLPEEFIPDMHQRLSFYKRLSSVQDEKELDQLEGELMDRFGPFPLPVQNLVSVMGLKLQCKKLRILRLETREEGIRFTLDPSHAVSEEGVTVLMERFDGTIRFLSEFCFQLSIKNHSWDETYQTIKNALNEIQTTLYNAQQRSPSK